MTPLAHRIVKDLTLPAHRRHGTDEGGIAHLLPRVHCFDCSAVRDLVWDLAWKFQQGKQEPGPLAFMPAPLTWIEFDSGRDDDGPRRDAYLVIEDSAANEARFHYAQDWIEPGSYHLFEQKGLIRLFGDAAPTASWKDTLHSQLEEMAAEGVDGAFDPASILDEGAVVVAALALINSPKVIGRRHHPPHKGLAKKLIPFAGGAPIAGWTEIILSIDASAAEDGEVRSSGILHGACALHFCRKHARIRNGRLEFVRAHWRGDPARGIRRSRYKVTE